MRQSNRATLVDPVESSGFGSFVRGRLFRACFLGEGLRSRVGANASLLLYRVGEVALRTAPATS